MTFAPRIVYGDLDLTDYPYSVEFGFDLGSAETLYDVISSLMVDGSLTSSPGSGNRQGLQLSVLTEGSDSGVLAELGAALDLEAGKQTNELVFYPGDGYGEPCVLDTFAAQSTHDWDQTLEKSGLRRFVLTIPARPFVRSVDATTLNWTGSPRETDLSTTTGWTVVGAGAISSAGGQIQKTTMDSDVTLSRSVALDEYLWLKTPGPVPAGTHLVTSVTVNGVSVPDATIRQEAVSSQHFYTIPTRAWLGQTATVQFTLSPGSAGTYATLEEFWTTPYPNKTEAGAATRPLGIDVIDVGGTARAPIALVSFTSPSGGAWLITGPDPNVALRDRGARENLYEKWTVAGGDPVYVPGDYARVTQQSQPQPASLNPNGIWPQYATGANKLAFPSDRGVAVSFFPAGDVLVVSASPDLPSGFHSTALIYEEHALSAGRSMFAVIAAATGNPIPATVTFYRHWKHYVA